MGLFSKIKKDRNKTTIETRNDDNKLIASSSIQVGKTDSRIDSDSNYKDTEVTWETIKEQEEVICKQIIKSTSFEDSQFFIAHRSDEYTTLFFFDSIFWIARVKYTPSSKWIKVGSVDSSKDLEFLKSIVTSDDDFRVSLTNEETISTLLPYFQYLCDEYIKLKDEQHNLPDDLQVVFEVIKQCLLNCGCKEENLDYYKTSTGMTGMYLMGKVHFKVRMYKKKDNQLILNDQEYSFSDINDIKSEIYENIKKALHIHL